MRRDRVYDNQPSLRNSYREIKDVLLAAGAAFAFITSFDEVVISIFLAGVETKTLPVKLWEQIRVEFTPVAAAGSTVILAITMLAFAAVQLTRRRRGGT